MLISTKGLLTMHKFKVAFKTRALYKVPYKKFGFASCFGSKIKIEGGRWLVFIPQLNGYIEKPIKNRVMYDDVITDCIELCEFYIEKEVKMFIIHHNQVWFVNYSGARRWINFDIKKIVHSFRYQNLLMKFHHWIMWIGLINTFHLLELIWNVI